MRGANSLFCYVLALRLSGLLDWESTLEIVWEVLLGTKGIWLFHR